LAFYPSRNMFATFTQLQEKRGKSGTSRFVHLQRLVTEFQDILQESKNDGKYFVSIYEVLEGKEQVLANLGNFAYDPINYDHFVSLCIIDLFLDCLEDPNPKLVEFAIGGLCNCCVGNLLEKTPVDTTDPRICKVIEESDGIPLILKCLSSNCEETVLSAITTLYYILPVVDQKQGKGQFDLS
jgi:hypothetical protein